MLISIKTPYGSQTIEDVVNIQITQNSPVQSDGYARFPNGEKVLDYCRKFYNGMIACRLFDSSIDGACVELCDEDLHLIEYNDELFGVISRADCDQWRCHEFKPDSKLIRFLRENTIRPFKYDSWSTK